MTIRTEGDEAAAIEALYDAFAPPLYRYAWSLLGDGDEQVAEAVHDGLVAGVALDARRADPADRGPWLYALVRSACQRRGLAHVSPYTGLATVPAEEPVARMFSRLPASHRELVELNLRHALPPSAAARVLGLDPQLCVELSRSALRRAAENLEEAADEAEGRFHAPGSTDGPGAGPPEGAGPLGPTRRRARELDRVSHALSLLRPPGPPPGLRERVVRTCLDPELAATRERVAAQMHPLTSEGYPLHRARVSGEPEEAAETAVSEPEPPPRALPGDRLTTRDHPVREEAVARLAGPGTGPGDDDRTSRRRWPLPAVSGLATVVVAVGLWSWASAMGGPSIVIGIGPEETERNPLVSEMEAVATSSDAKPEAGPTTVPTAVASEQPGVEASAEPEPEESTGREAPAPDGAEPTPPAGTGGSGDASEAPGAEGAGGGDSADGGAPSETPEEGDSDDGDDPDLLEGLLGLLFGDG
ncbi:sigma-70 family RNA polymerase sigma factor [Nocardiopsis quinghaiensis]|uniref:sigma-70 family RNA polymerase sigma factor n=1 Tax=Nocardiopsis quinghaiensis TaxID=464995 RepID=UPI0012388CD8|nr:sigma-70 family RNA polymerase sigma factor [Nocardiopsis quinghaiensis]